LDIVSAEEITVTFRDGSIVPGVYVQHDVNLGLSVVSVELSEMSEETMDVIGVVGLGSSRSSGMLASPVIAYGKIFGKTDSVAYGMITEENTIMNMPDINYELLATDIYGSEDASGFVINTAGYLLGIIYQEQNAPETKNLISFVGITELRKTLERMSNGREITFLGIEGMDVTQEANLAQGVPLGAYVTEVIMDSPAMKAGIQRGDIITSIDGISIVSYTQYVEILSEYEPEETINVHLSRQGVEEYVDIEIPIILAKRK
jgi:serine protease Do